MTSIIELEEICKKGQKRRKFEVTACDPTTIEKISNFDKRSSKLLEKDNLFHITTIKRKVTSR